MAASLHRPTETRMRLRYGVNETDSWWHFALGPQLETIWGRLREMDTRIIRIFGFDKKTKMRMMRVSISRSRPQMDSRCGPRSEEHTSELQSRLHLVFP